MADVIYKRGPSNKLNDVTVQDGQILITADQGEMYVDLPSGRKKITDTNKVDKDGNKVLSTNDFTDEYKEKLDNIEDEATKTIVDTTYNKDVNAQSLNPQSGVAVAAAIAQAQLEESDVDLTPYVQKEELKTINNQSLIIGEDGITNIVIEGGGTAIIIDQNYNPESENAQSGKAVAEAITPIEEAIKNKPGATTSEQGEVFNNYTNNVASAKYSHAEGNTTEAIATASHAEGYKVKVSGAAAHSEGVLTEAKGTSSHTEGRETVALGYVAHAEGHKTEAIGHGSHTEGAITKAISDNAHAEGVSTVAGTKGFKITNIEIDTTKNTGTLFIIDGSNVVIPEQPEGEYDEPVEYVTDKVTECYAIGDLLNIDVDKHQYDKYSITSLEDGKIHFAGIDPFNVTNATDELVLGSAAEDNYVWVENKHFGETIDQCSGVHAEGSYTTAIGWGAHSEGRNTKAIGNYSHAEGRQTIANYGAHAEGRGTKAKGHMSHTEGQNTTAIGECSHAEGKGTTAQGYYSHAEGYVTKAIGNSSHASGDHTVAGYRNQFVTGVYNDNKTNSLFEVGYGLADDQRRNALEVLDNGTAELAKQGSNDTSVVIKSTLTSELNNKPGTKIANGGELFNSAKTASGTYSHAEGWGTNAVGTSSHAEGESTNAYGPRSHAEGQGSRTGEEGTNIGTASHAEGCRTVASGYCAHSEGYETVASHYYSHAGGYSTKTGCDYQTVIGKYNTGNANTLFEIGNGTSNDDRHNIFEVGTEDSQEYAKINNNYVCTANANINFVMSETRPDNAPAGTIWIQLL